MNMSCKLYVLLVCTLLLVAFGQGQPCGGKTCPEGYPCCNDTSIGQVCFNPAQYACVGNNKLCAAGLSVCGGKCYDGVQYDCWGDSKLCPKQFQLCGSDQCYDSSINTCLGNGVLGAVGATTCNNISFSDAIYTCLNGILVPKRTPTNCTANQAECGRYCYDPQLYFCSSEQTGNLTARNGVCGQGFVWCEAPAQRCYDPHLYTCTGGTLTPFTVGNACPGSQTLCGAGCYDTSIHHCLNGSVICPIGQGVCNNTCFNTDRYDCLNEVLTMHPGYCPPGQGLCGARCYDVSAYNCSLEILMPMAGGSCSASNPCQNGDQCCDDSEQGPLCFDSSVYSCVNARLCGKGMQVCGNRCFDPAIYQCQNGFKLCTPGQVLCNGNCFDPTKYTCLNSSVLCPIGNEDFSCYGVCFDADKYKCNTTDNSLSVFTCKSPLRACGGECYNPTLLQCVNHKVEERNVSCVSGFERCNLTCFDPTKKMCVDGIVVNKNDTINNETGTCPSGQLECGVKGCYAPTTQECIQNTVVDKCPSDRSSRCALVCYDKATHECINEEVVERENNCPSGKQLCVTVCYDASLNRCEDGQVVPLPTASPRPPTAAPTTTPTAAPVGPSGAFTLAPSITLLLILFSFLCIIHNNVY